MYRIGVLVILCIVCISFIHSSEAVAVHGQMDHNTLEREEDGSYRARDYDHYSHDSHNVEFDHEAILGSVKTAEEFEKLSPEESKKRLGQLLPLMDLDKDGSISREELKEWILNSFKKLAREEAQERMGEMDVDHDGALSWPEYLQDAFGAPSEDEIEFDGNDDASLLEEEKEMWKIADVNGDGLLDLDELEVFVNPEEHEQMHGALVRQALREKDLDGNGKLDFKEYLGQRGAGQSPEGDPSSGWMIAERDKFDKELDIDGDGVLTEREVKAWLIPDNLEIAMEEVDHLFAAADEDQDARLTFAEVLDHYDVFVGSAATDYGDHLHHYEDEL